MFEEDRDEKIYNLIITQGFDKNNEYGQFTEKLYSKVEFRWKESISGSYATAGEGFYKKVDRIIMLAIRNCLKTCWMQAKNMKYLLFS